jgi:hypothetical protein
MSQISRELISSIVDEVLEKDETLRGIDREKNNKLYFSTCLCCGS